MNIKFLRFVVIAMALVSASAGSALSQEGKTIKIVRQSVIREFNPAFKGKGEQEIEALEHQLADALRLKDASKLEVLLSDTVLVAGLIADKKQFIAYLKTTDTNYYSIEKGEMRVQMYGDAAVATGIQKANIDIEGGSRFSQTVFMNTWKRVDGTWRCIAFAN
jgi:ketosteroid isomerase-like protein